MEKVIQTFKFKPKEIVVDKLPLCDFCIIRGETQYAHYDGRTKQGPWANMCELCFKYHGVGFGIGKGQKLVLSKERI